MAKERNNIIIKIKTEKKFKQKKRREEETVKSGVMNLFDQILLDSP